MNQVIDIRNCSASYGAQEVLRGVSLRIEEGEFAVIIGASGCGKTTLLKLMNGLVRPLSGEVLVEGRNLNDCDLIALRRRIGYAVQGAKLFPHMTVEDNICYVAGLLDKLSKEQKRELAGRMLTMVRLEPSLRERFPAQLSGGQQQRVGIARALAANPRLLLMDEPFGAVDEITRKELQKELLALQQSLGVTVVFITHDIREAVRLGSRIIVMQEGRILQDGTAEQLKRQPAADYVRLLLEDIG